MTERFVRTMLLRRLIRTKPWQSPVFLGNHNSERGQQGKHVVLGTVKITSWLKTVVCVLAGLLLLHLMAISIHDAVLERRALNTLENFQQHGTPYRWDMRKPAALLDYEQYGLAELSFDQDGMLLVAENDAPYFWLNLADMGIDAERYTRLEIELYSSADNQLSFVFGNDHSGVKTLYRNLVHSSAVPVSEGWQTITLELTGLTWRHVGVSKAVTEWGGESGLVSGLRINPGVIAGEQMHFRSVILTNPDRSVPGRAPEWYPVSISTDLSVIKRAATPYLNDTVVLFDTSRFRTVETSRLLREQVAREIPGAILFPNMNRAVETRTVPLDFPPGLTFSPGWAKTVCYGLMAILALAMSLSVMRTNPVDQVKFFRRRYQPLLYLLLFFGTLWGLVSIAASPWLVGSISLMLVGYILSLMYWRRKENNYNWLQECGLIRAERTLWVISLTMITGMVAVILVLGFYFDTFDQTDTKVLLKNIWQYPLWGLVQQVLLGPVLGREIFRMLGGKEDVPAQSQSDTVWLSSLSAGFIFGLLHTPNFSLMAATFPLGFFWCWLYLRYRSVIPLALTHAVLATLFRELAPDVLRLDGDVTMTYYHWLWV